jgi:large subunit ribosomal protein L22
MKESKIDIQEVSKASLKNARSSPKKMLLAVKLIAGMPVLKAKSQLSHQPQKSCFILLGLLNSAIANAVNKNKEMDLEKVFVRNIDIGPGDTRKKGHARARGRYNIVVKRFSNITISLNLKEQNGK